MQHMHILSLMSVSFVPKSLCLGGKNSGRTYIRFLASCIVAPAFFYGQEGLAIQQAWSWKNNSGQKAAWEDYVEVSEVHVASFVPVLTKP